MATTHVAREVEGAPRIVPVAPVEVTLDVGGKCVEKQLDVVSTEVGGYPSTYVGSVAPKPDGVVAK